MITVFVMFIFVNNIYIFICAIKKTKSKELFHTNRNENHHQQQQHKNQIKFKSNNREREKRKNRSNMHNIIIISYIFYQVFLCLLFFCSCFVLFLLLYDLSCIFRLCF